MVQINQVLEGQNATTKWQIIIYDAIIRSKLLYGLETVQLTQSMKKELDAFVKHTKSMP